MVARPVDRVHAAGRCTGPQPRTTRVRLVRGAAWARWLVGADADPGPAVVTTPPSPATRVVTSRAARRTGLSAS